jgi:hypothetical protein
VADARRAPQLNDLRAARADGEQGSTGVADQVVEGVGAAVARSVGDRDRRGVERMHEPAASPLGLTSAPPSASTAAIATNGDAPSGSAIPSPPPTGAGAGADQSSERMMALAQWRNASSTATVAAASARRSRLLMRSVSP